MPQHGSQIFDRYFSCGHLIIRLQLNGNSYISICRTKIDPSRPGCSELSSTWHVVHSRGVHSWHSRRRRSRDSGCEYLLSFLLGRRAPRPSLVSKSLSCHAKSMHPSHLCRPVFADMPESSFRLGQPSTPTFWIRFSTKADHASAGLAGTLPCHRPIQNRSDLVDRIAVSTRSINWRSLLSCLVHIVSFAFRVRRSNGRY